MSDRRTQIVLLLGSLFDFDHEPLTGTGKIVRRASIAGKGSPSHWQPCPHCEGGSKRGKFGKLEPCAKCGATGKLRIDDYTGEVVVTDEDREVSLGELIRRDTKHVQCPDCQDLHGQSTGLLEGRMNNAPRCRRCDGKLVVPVAGSWLSAPYGEERASGDAVDAMLHAIERRNELGSYHELEQALAGIAHHVNKPPRFTALTYEATRALRLLTEVHVVGSRERSSLSRFEEALHELAMSYLDSRMPTPIRVPRDVVRNARERQQVLKGNALNGLSRERRDKQIRQWDRQGKPRQWIGQQTGLSDRQLREIINGKGVAA